MAKLFYYLLFTFIFFSSFSQSDRSIPYTLTDRDRGVRTEEKIEYFDKEISALHAKIDFSQYLLIASLMISVGQFAFLYLIWSDIKKYQNRVTQKPKDIDNDQRITKLEGMMQKVLEKIKVVDN